VTLAEAGGHHPPGRAELDWAIHLAAKASLATLLLDYPELAVTYAQDVVNAHPAYDYHAHRMLGRGWSWATQSDLAKDGVLLLQLASDECGPRFQWWDMGEITFWISRGDLAQQRFERSQAEIDG
jgi:uncharacterized protein YwqG